MNVQELIDLLINIEDKSVEVVVEYDSSYYPVTYINKKPLFSDDNGRNIYDYKEPDAELYPAIIINYF